MQRVGNEVQAEAGMSLGMVRAAATAAALAVLSAPAPAAASLLPLLLLWPTTLVLATAGGREQPRQVLGRRMLQAQGAAALVGSPAFGTGALKTLPTSAAPALGLQPAA